MSIFWGVVQSSFFDGTFYIPYTSAEIPPAGAPSGFDSAAFADCIVHRYEALPLRSG